MWIRLLRFSLALFLRNIRCDALLLIGVVNRRWLGCSLLAQYMQRRSLPWHGCDVVFVLFVSYIIFLLFVFVVFLFDCADFSA